MASAGALAATALGGGALAAGEHPPATGQGVGPASLQLEAFAPSPPGEVPVVDVRASVEPVAGEPGTFDATALVKAVTIGERQQAAAAATTQQAAARTAGQKATSTCAAGDSGFETVKSWVADAGVELRCRFDIDTVYGVAGRAGSSDHPAGLALDLMVASDPGEDLAAYAVQNRDRLGIKYVIYRQRINSGSGWEAMEDRGGTTTNHMDHVQISFERQ